MTYETNKNYLKLVAKWLEYKELETLANQGRIRSEKEILEIVGKDLKEKGSNPFPGGVKITTGMDEKWDSNLVNDIYQRWSDGEIATLPFFPFITDWKPESKKLSILKETMSEAAFYKIFSDALTIKPKKPSFEIKVKN